MGVLRVLCWFIPLVYWFIFTLLVFNDVLLVYIVVWVVGFEKFLNGL